MDQAKGRSILSKLVRAVVGVAVIGTGVAVYYLYVAWWRRKNSNEHGKRKPKAEDQQRLKAREAKKSDPLDEPKEATAEKPPGDKTDEFREATEPPAQNDQKKEAKFAVQDKTPRESVVERSSDSSSLEKSNLSVPKNNNDDDKSDDWIHASEYFRKGEQKKLTA
ncbi:hypothetical protein AAMO2058_001257600 [Amorphochlora amoebiformis]